LHIGHLAIIDTGPSFTGELSLRGILGGALRILQNFPWWIWEDLLDCRPVEMPKRIRRKIHEWKKRLIKRVNSRQKGFELADLEDIFELGGLPEDYVQTMEHHLKLLRSHTPGLYSGPLTLYRARTQPLLSTAKADLGWSSLVNEGIEIIKLHGNHKTIINKPYIQFLAKALRNSLQAVPRKRQEESNTHK
jgi:hypothetical protein